MTSILKLLLTLGARWQAWAAVLAICVALEGGALIYQEVFFYYPCELCVYTRVWIAAMGLVALAGIFLCRFPWAVRGLLVAEIAFTIGLAGVVWKLLAMEYGFVREGACNLVAQFPAWARLDEWFPMMFRVQASCGETPEVLLGISMAEGLAVMILGFLLTFAVALVGSFTAAPPAPSPQRG